MSAQARPRTKLPRISRAGLIAGPVYAALGLAWTLARPAGPFEAYVIWFLLVAVAGLFLPGAANQVTLSRAYLAAPALAYTLVPGTLGALAIAVALAGVSDLLDGALARLLRQTSALGGALDPVVDGLFFGAVAVGLAAGGAYPWWLAAVVVGRYGLPAVGGAVALLAGLRPQIRHTFFGQLCTTLIAVLLGGVALFRGLGLEAGMLVRVAAVVIPLATLLTFVDLGRVLLRTRP